LVVAIVFQKQANLVLDPRLITFFLLGRPHLSVYANLFIVGMMFYKIQKEGFSPKRYAIITFCILVYRLQHFWWETLILILFILLFHFMLRGSLAFINQKPLIFMGTISYTLYLVHQNIGYIIIRTLYKLGINPNTSIFIAIAFSLLLASTITFLIEQPMLRLIKEQYKTKMLKQQ
jgi:peptidoglycan/LPS O-acetylase OafA/YrhL